MDFLQRLNDLGGVLPTGSDSLLPLLEAEIKDLERLAGHEFPAGYRQFLSEAGGFVFNENIGFPTRDPLPREFSRSGLALMGAFFTSSRAQAHRSATLAWNIEQSPGYYPDGMIAIGQDGAGGIILLNLNRSSRGSVLYYPQTNDWYKSDSEDPYRAAENFEAFVASFRILEAP